MEPEFAYLTTQESHTKLRDVHPRVTMVPDERHVRVEIYAVHGVIGENAIQCSQVIMTAEFDMQEIEVCAFLPLIICAFF
ncbi:hypothetical protein DPMN_190977 [Dreissena polymorpha]|uniref:Uncharacterized protein n=1 Tax=Dreissena polymorpha TaxID=45954 RepID=A0A9D3Y3H4_DREPO|nr:hypothetical protein DPMN_190977 [Dreissena polymorpha]